MEPHIHIVQYYETDKMAITHHSNYIRWMEEARVSFLNQIGWGFDKMEEMGLASPVLTVSSHFLHSTTFADTVSIEAYIKECSGLKLFIGYIMKNAKTGQTVCTGETSHCFFNSEGRPVRLQKDYPELFAALEENRLQHEGKTQR